MDKEVILTIVGAVASLVAALAAVRYGYHLTTRSGSRDQAAIDPSDEQATIDPGDEQATIDRSIAIVGVWEGEGADTTRGGRRAETFEVIWDLRVQEGKVIGTSRMRYPDEEWTTFTLRGEFLHTDYCRLLYTVIRTHGTVRFGAVVVRLRMETRTLEGMYMGYSSRDPEGIVTGSVRLTKQV